MKRHLLPLIFLLVLACEREELQIQRFGTEPQLSVSEAPTHIIQLNPAVFGVQPRQEAQPDYPRQVREAALKLFSRLGIHKNGVAEETYTHVFLGFAASISEEEAELLRRQKEVLAIEENSIFSLAQSITSKGKTISIPDQITPWGVSMIKGPFKKSERAAWILDTGIDLSHPDLNVDKERSRSFVPWYYYEFDPNDLNGHGTHVAGVIGALDNSIGTVGVAAGTQVVAVKVLSRSGVGVLSTILKGVDYIMENAAPGDVVNMSLSGRASEIFDLSVIALAESGIRVVIAAGNQSRSIEQVSPARIEVENVYTVSAIDSRESFASFSNFGKGIDSAEPGVDIPSTYRYGGYAMISGTSAAAPHLAGLLLLDNRVRLMPMGFAQSDPDGEPDPIMAGQ